MPGIGFLIASLRSDFSYALSRALMMMIALNSLGRQKKGAQAEGRGRKRQGIREGEAK